MHASKVHEKWVFNTVLKKKCYKPHRLHVTSVPVAADGHALVHAVSGARDDVVEFVGHAARARHVSHTAGPVQLGRQDVVQHAARVADLEAAWFDASHLQQSPASLGGRSTTRLWAQFTVWGGVLLLGRWWWRPSRLPSWSASVSGLRGFLLRWLRSCGSESSVFIRKQEPLDSCDNHQIFLLLTNLAIIVVFSRLVTIIFICTCYFGHLFNLDLICYCWKLTAFLFSNKYIKIKYWSVT